MATRKSLITPLKTGFLLALALLLLAGSPVSAADVKLPAELNVAGQKLVLNGSGIRKKFFFSIYACGLYLPKPEKDVKKVIAADEPKAIIMHMIHSKVSKEKIVKAWDDGFFKNSQEKLDQLKDRIATFDAIFNRDLVAGDRLVMSYVPGQGTIVKFNDEVHKPIPGKDFNDALLAIWLGDNPADDDLKEAMLGID
jgi:hypothetical protein